MNSVTRAPRTTLLAVTLAALLAVSGCGADDPESAPPAAPATSKPATKPAAKPSRTVTPTSSATPSSPAPTTKPRRHKVGALAPNARPQARARTVAHLLAAEDLPPVAGDWTARDAASEPTVGACQKTPLSTIGAMESAQRIFSADGATAVQVVARFGDAKSAWRAHEVLAAWRDDCAERLGNPRADIGPLEDVSVPVGTGSSYRSASKKTTTGLGILRSGEFLTLVEITAAPSSYPGGWEPARVAVRRVSRTF